MRKRALAVLLVLQLPVIAFGASHRVRTIGGVEIGPGHRDATGYQARFSAPMRMTRTCDGAFVVADRGNHTIRRFTRDGVVTTLAGTPFERGASDGKPGKFRGPEGVTLAPDCSIWVADTFNHAIRRITPDGTVSTIAGQPGVSGDADGRGSDARFVEPSDIAFDPVSGDAYVADMHTSKLRVVKSDGRVSTIDSPVTQPTALAFGPQGHLVVMELGQGFMYARTGSSWKRLTVNPRPYPGDAVVTADGVIFYTDDFNNTINSIRIDGSEPRIIVGEYAKGGFSDADGSAVRMWQPVGIEFDGDSIVFSDSRNHVLRRLTGDRVRTFAGQVAILGANDGPVSEARFARPTDAVEGPDGTIYVAEWYSVRKITPDGYVTTIAGDTNTPGRVDGPGAAARFNGLSGIVLNEGTGELFVNDVVDHTIRRISPDGTVTTVVGVAGQTGTQNGIGTAARLNYPYGLGIDPAGNLYLAEVGNHAIRKVAAGTYEVSTFAGVNGVIGGGDGPANAPRFFNPWDVDVDDNGVVYVIDENTHVVQKIENGQVTTLAKTSIRYRNFEIAVAPDGQVYTAESQSVVIRRVSNGELVSFVGEEHEPGFIDGRADRARVSAAGGLDISRNGRMIIADTENRAIRIVELIEGATVDSFAALPDQIAEGGSTRLEWCTTEADSVIIGGIGAVAACGSMTVSPSATTTYVIRAVGGGRSEEQSVSVRVKPRRQRSVR